MRRMSRVFGVEIELCAELKTVQHKNRKIVIENQHQMPHLSWNARDEMRFAESMLASHGTPFPRGQFDLLPGWKQVRDGSCGSELVSPPIIDMWSVREMLHRVEESGIKYTLEDTGLHVHVQAIDYDDDMLANVAKFCRHFDRAIYSFMDKQRIHNSYCRPVGKSNQRLQQDITKGLTSMDRYRGCNIAAFEKHGTIEFRYAEGTVNPDRIEALVELYTSIVDWCVAYEPVKSPKKIVDKRAFLLDMLCISTKNKEILLRGN